MVLIHIIIDKVSNNQFLDYYELLKTEEDDIQLWPINSRTNSDKFNEIASVNDIMQLEEELKELGVHPTNNARVRVFLCRWFFISKIAQDVKPNDIILYVRSDVKVGLDWILEHSSLAKKPLIYGTNKYRIANLRFFKRYFLYHHFFDGLLIGRSASFVDLYSDVLDVCATLPVQRNIIHRRKPLLELLLSLNTPRVNFRGDHPELILKKALSTKLKLSKRYYSSIVWRPYRPLGIKDFIFRVPFWRF